MPLILALLYVVLCVLCGLMGRRTAIGFVGHLLLALLITPVGDILVQLFGRPSRAVRQQLERLPEE